MKKTLILSIISLFPFISFALDIATKDGISYKNIQDVSFTSVGLRFNLDGKSKFVGNVDLTDEAKNNIWVYQQKIITDKIAEKQEIERRSRIYTDGKNEYDIKKSSIKREVDNSTGRNSGIAVEMGSFGEINGKVLQSIHDDLVLVSVGQSILAINKVGIGINAVDDQKFNGVILRTGTFKYTAVSGGTKSVPACIILVKKYQ